MSARFRSRLLLTAAVLARLPKLIGRQKPTVVKKILVIHQLLLGDSLMITPLLAKLRARYPDAQIYCALPSGIVSLYNNRPWGVIAVSYTLKEPQSIRQLIQLGPFDLAFVPGDNRHGWGAFAAGSRWIVGHDTDQPSLRNYCFDALKPLDKQRLTTWPDMITDLCDGSAVQPYQQNDWPAPTAKPFSLPTKPYAVLQIGASTALKYWPVANWLSLMRWLECQGLSVVLTTGPGEEQLLRAIDPKAQYQQFPGDLSLPQFWQLIAQAQLFVTPDTGVSRIGKLTNTATVALYGPGPAFSLGRGHYWRNMPFASVSIAISCRDSNKLFNRAAPWIRACKRNTSQCQDNQCMKRITVDQVVAAAKRLWAKQNP